MGSETALTPRDKYRDVRSLLERMKADMAMALPRHLTPERMVRTTLTSIRRNPKLLDCSMESLMGAVMQCSQLGLEPDGVLGYAYLIPYKQECQLQLGYKGMLNLARRSGEIKSVQARAVHEGDVFEYEYGLDERCRHVPAGKEDAAITNVYAIVRLKDGGVQFDVMTVSDVARIRARSRARDSGPWVTDYEAMACKTVLKRTLKLCPTSVEVQRAIALDDLADAGVAQELAKDLVPKTPELPEPDLPEPSGAASKLDRLADEIEKKTAPKAEEATDPDPDYDPDCEICMEERPGPKTAKTPKVEAPKEKAAASDDDDPTGGLEPTKVDLHEVPKTEEAKPETTPDARIRKALLDEIAGITHKLGMTKAEVRKFVGKPSDQLSTLELAEVRDKLLEAKTE